MGRQGPGAPGCAGAAAPGNRREAGLGAAVHRQPRSCAAQRAGGDLHPSSREWEPGACTFEGCGRAPGSPWSPPGRAASAGRGGCCAPSARAPLRRPALPSFALLVSEPPLLGRQEPPAWRARGGGAADSVLPALLREGGSAATGGEGLRAEAGEPGLARVAGPGGGGAARAGRQGGPRAADPGGRVLAAPRALCFPKCCQVCGDRPGYPLACANSATWGGRERTAEGQRPPAGCRAGVLPVLLPRRRRALSQRAKARSAGRPGVPRTGVWQGSAPEEGCARGGCTRTPGPLRSDHGEHSGNSRGGRLT